MFCLSVTRSYVTHWQVFIKNRPINVCLLLASVEPPCRRKCTQLNKLSRLLDATVMDPPPPPAAETRSETQRWEKWGRLIPWQKEIAFSYFHLFTFPASREWKMASVNRKLM